MEVSREESKAEIEKLRQEVEALKVVRPAEFQHIIYSISRLTKRNLPQAAAKSGALAPGATSAGTHTPTPETRPNIAREQKIDPWSVSSAVDSQGMTHQSMECLLGKLCNCQ